MEEPTKNLAPDEPDSGEKLIKRAPGGYLWNQAGALWLFISLLLFEVVVRRTLPASATNAFDLVSSVANVGFYLAALGLASAGAVYLPRALAEGGPGLARSLAMRLVATRVAMAALVGTAIVWGLPVLSQAAQGSRAAPLMRLATSYGVQVTLAHRVAIAAYVVTVAISTIFSASLVALVRTRVVFIIGSLGQLLLLVCTYLFLHTFSGGVDGALYAQAVPMALSAGVFALALARVLRVRSVSLGKHFYWPAVRLGMASWLADLPQSSLVQPVALGQLSAVAPGDLRFFKSTYQMGDAGARFFTEGLGGVSMATMSATYANGRVDSLATGWRTVNKLQVLLAVPVVALAVPYSATIMSLLFGQAYAASGYLLAFFLVANGLLQLLGGATHEWTLYVVGAQRWVVLSRWVTLAVVALSGVFLVPRFFALGALLAVALGRLVAQFFLLLMAWVHVRRPYPLAFAGKLLLTLVAPVLAISLWQPEGRVHSWLGHLAWVPASLRLPLEQGATLAIAGVIFLLLFLIGMRLVRPLDAEDAALLAQMPRLLRGMLAPFVARRHRHALLAR